MDQNLAANNIENDDLNLNSEESDYENLINRLADIKKTIAILEKKFLNKL